MIRHVLSTIKQSFIVEDLEDEDELSCGGSGETKTVLFVLGLLLVLLFVFRSWAGFGQ